MTKICPNCKNSFEPHTYNQKYCCLKCQKIESLKMNKEHARIKRKEARDEIEFPFFICQKCGHKFQLTFTPFHNVRLLDALICPKCHKKAK